ncbi:chloride channel protein [Tepidibacillus decaturensis]|uniref:Voltage-gated chloride channel n=1 Tax=Tepidibacillus decaturensis TaxID=1413211 RepID=A0A135L6S5_9BACI|nr:chloride channel protein [Tepidibacillus decaturensis]KXG44688.1 hypothetical protein U473_12140 [Tepidibacillus decaturensis]
MKKEINQEVLEESILLLSTIKWIFLSIFVGTVVGGVTALFLNTLAYGTEKAAEWPYYYLFMPIAFFLSSWMVLRFAPDAAGHGTEKVIESIHKKNGKIDVKVVPIKVFATLVTLISGGSAGKEGPSAQIGAGIASAFSDLFRFNEDDRRRFVICGISAGFAGVFGTPIAGAIFAAEVLFIGKFSYRVLLPSLISAYVSFHINEYLGVKHFKYAIQVPAKSEISMFFYLILFGILIGLISLLLIKALHIIEAYFQYSLKIYKPLKGFIGGFILIFIVLLTHSKDYIGLGTYVIDQALAGHKVDSLSFFIKIFTTSVTLGSGGSGGILTPVFYIGSTLGNAWAQLIHGDLAMYSAIGMVSFLAASANTPLAAIIMAMELFGVKVATYASIVSVISYLVVGHRSVYPSQILSMSKSPSIDTDINCEIRQIQKLRLSNKMHVLLHNQKEKDN